MKQEFQTVRGKVIFDGEKFKIINVQPKNRSDTYLLIIFSFSIFYHFTKNEALPLVYAGIVIYGFLILIMLYEYLFIKVLKNTIYLHKISSYKIYNDHHGLETVVTLKLQSGRTKEIPFRTKEKEYEAFVDLVSKQLTSQAISIS